MGLKKGLFLVVEGRNVTTKNSWYFNRNKHKTLSAPSYLAVMSFSAGYWTLVSISVQPSRRHSDTNYTHSLIALSLHCYAVLHLTALRCVNYTLHLFVWLDCHHAAFLCIFIVGNGSEGIWLHWPDVSYIIFQWVLNVSCQEAGKGQINGGYCWVAHRSGLSMMTLICALEHTQDLLSWRIVIFKPVM